MSLTPNLLATFDGRVLELFGGSVRRFHVTLLTVTVSGPDKRGNRTVTFEQSQNEWGVPLDDAAYQGIQPLLGALGQAGVPVRTDA